MCSEIILSFSLPLPSLFLPPSLSPFLPLSSSLQHKERTAEITQNISQTGLLQRMSSQTLSTHNHHLCLKVDTVDHQFPEDSEVFFFLFDHARKWHVSERFMMSVKKSVTNKAQDPKGHVTQGQSSKSDKGHDPKIHTAVFTVRKTICVLISKVSTGIDV